MKLEIKIEQIVNLINDNYPSGNTTDILYELIDKCTHSWDEYRKLTIKMLENLNEQAELIGVIEAVR